MRTDLPFGRWLKRRRVELNLTQAELARRVSYSIVTIRKIESEELRPSLQVAERLAEQLDIPPEDRAAFIRFARGEAGSDALTTQGPPPGSWHPSLVASQPALPPVRLPVPPTSLIGREQEIEDLRRLLLDGNMRLVTLAGTGGVGKTRLALEVAQGLADQFPDGVYFVDLAPVEPAHLVPQAIAAALGVEERARAPLVRVLQDYLQNRKLLLLLDNFEHLIPAAPLVSELLSAAPGLHVLATSREALKLRGEYEFRVLPLAAPARVDGTSFTGYGEIEELLRYPAIELFVRRAEAVQPGFALSARNAPVIVDICSRLDGLPLAIELAAARMRLFTPRDLAERLGSRLSLLVAGPRDLPARQRTLLDTLAWSYDLLYASEQRLFQRLAVFAGGCTLEAAEAVCFTPGDAPGSASASATEIGSLVDKNLLWRREAANGKVRVGMLETVREYAWEQLRVSGEAPATQRRHAEYFLRLAETAERELRGPNQTAYLDQLDAEHDNLRAALRWALDSDSAAAGNIALRLAGALRWFWTLRSHVTEGLEWVRDALARPSAPSAGPARARALWCAGVLAWLSGDKDASTLLTESVEVWRSVGDKAGLAYSLQHLGLVAFSKRELEKARSLEMESIALFRAEGDKPGESLAMLSLANAAIESGDLEGASVLLDKCVQISRETGDKWVLALSLRDLGRLAVRRKDYPLAGPLLEESISLFLEMGTKHELATTLDEAAGVESELGEDARAAWLWQQALALWRDLSVPRGEANALLHMGRTARLNGDYTAAHSWLIEGLSRLRPVPTDNVRWVCDLLREFGALAAAQDQPDRAQLLLGAAEALRSEAALLPHMPGDEPAVALTQEKRPALDIEQAIEYALQGS